MKKILITGSNGFIGSFLTDEAIKRGYDTFAGIRSTSRLDFLRDKPVSLFELDLSSPKKLESTLASFRERHGKFDYIIHNAGTTKAKDKADYFRINNGYTQNFIKAIIDTGSVPDKFVYISSLAAYGPGKGSTPIKESDIPQPITLYGQSKRAAEQFIKSLPDFPFVIIRPSAVYGPRDKAFLSLVKIIKRGFEPYIGKNEQLLSFVHVSDVAQIVLNTMEHAPTGKGYFISDGNSYTNYSFNGLLRKHLHASTIKVTLPIGFINTLALWMEKFSALFGTDNSFNRERVKEFKASNWSCDTAQLKSDVNFVPSFNLDNGLKDTISWYRKEGWIS